MLGAKKFTAIPAFASSALGLHSRQIDRDGGSFARCALNRGAAAALTRKSVDAREAEAGTRALFFRREEWLEGARKDVRRHTGARVRHGNRDEFAGEAVLFAGERTIFCRD